MAKIISILIVSLVSFSLHAGQKQSVDGRSSQFVFVNDCNQQMVGSDFAKLLKEAKENAVANAAEICGENKMEIFAENSVETACHAALNGVHFFVPMVSVKVNLSFGCEAPVDL